MSDWIEREPNPTLAVNFPWKSEPLITCLNCNQRVNTALARRHVMVGNFEDGCGIEFEFITTAAADIVWKQAVQDMRPDLKWKNVEWA